MSRDPYTTRRRILDAAADAFAGLGYAGARVDAIAAAAGTNKRMLYHYFGDKLGLHQAVLDWLLPDDGGQPQTAVPLPPRTARLLLWSLLEPATAASTRRRWGARLSGNGGAVLLSSLIGALVGGGRPVKPRIRLTHAPAPVPGAGPRPADP